MSNDNHASKTYAFRLTLLAIIALIAFSALTFLTGSLAVLLPGLTIAEYLKQLPAAASIMNHVQLLLYLIPFIVGLQVALVFFLWNFRLFSGNPYIPIRSILLWTLTLGGTLYWHLRFFGGAFHHHSSLMAWGSLGLNVVLFVLTTGLLFSGLSNPKFTTNLAFNFLLFLWMFYCAFPWYFAMI